jgi:hypothetical protein
MNIDKELGMDQILAIRDRVTEKLKQREHEADCRASDPYWNHGRHSPMRWVSRAFYAAVTIVSTSKPAANENVREYMTRLSNAVRAKRGDGSDDDDEAWYDSAIDEACSIIAMAAHEAAIEPHRADSGPVR